jgi:hypothetical protein
MTPKLDRALIQNRAEKIVSKNGFTYFPIDPKQIAENSRINVIPKDDSTEGVSGFLLKLGDNFCIAYSTFYRNQGFENFSIGHELGHYFLDGHTDQLFKINGTHVSHANFVSDDPLEREADIFSSSLLMPEDLFKNTLWKFGKGLDTVLGMADLCKTSLTATAIRYAELTGDFIIVVISTNSYIDYCCLSSKVFHLKNKEIPKKKWPIFKETATALLAKDTSRVLRGDKDSAQTDLADWIECDRSRIALEEVIGLGKYGKVLTVISI